VGTHYSYSRVGAVEIKKSAAGTVLLFSHLDLRPANGPDLTIVIGNTALPKNGRYLFKAVYTTSKPEILTSPGTGAETAALVVAPTIADFARTIEQGPYNEQPDTYTKTGFAWSPGKNTAGIQLLQSLDKGKSWTPAPAVIDAKQGTRCRVRPVARQAVCFQALGKGGR